MEISPSNKDKNKASTSRCAKQRFQTLFVHVPLLPSRKRKRIMITDQQRSLSPSLPSSKKDHIHTIKLTRHNEKTFINTFQQSPKKQRIDTSLRRTLNAAKKQRQPDITHGYKYPPLPHHFISLLQSLRSQLNKQKQLDKQKIKSQKSKEPKERDKQLSSTSRRTSRSPFCTTPR